MKEPTVAYFGCLTTILLVAILVTMFAWLQEHVGTVSLVVVVVLGTGVLLRLRHRKVPNTTITVTNMPILNSGDVLQVSGERVVVKSVGETNERANHLMAGLTESLRGRERRRK